MSTLYDPHTSYTYQQSRHENLHLYNQILKCRRASVAQNMFDLHTCTVRTPPMPNSSAIVNYCDKSFVCKPEDSANRGDSAEHARQKCYDSFRHMWHVGYSGALGRQIMCVRGATTCEEVQKCERFAPPLDSQARAPRLSDAKNGVLVGPPTRQRSHSTREAVPLPSINEAHPKTS